MGITDPIWVQQTELYQKRVQMQNISSPENLLDYSKREICNFNNSHGSRESSESPIGTHLLTHSIKGKANLQYRYILNPTIEYSLLYSLYILLLLFYSNSHSGIGSGTIATPPTPWSVTSDRLFILSRL
jgi:hypothetical protein